MSKYSDREQAYLMRPRQVMEERGNRTREIGRYNELVDIRKLGASPELWEKMLDQRARQLGKLFVEYRAGRSTVEDVTTDGTQETATVPGASKAEVFAVKLF
jgi:hypothetical protein